MYLLPPTLLLFCHLALSTGSPNPPLLTSPHAISLMPRNTLFYRQLADLQTFDSALGGVHASSITNSGIPDRPFAVEENSFPDFATAAQRSCDQQFQGCQQMANANGNGNQKQDRQDGSSSGRNGKGRGKTQNESGEGSNGGGKLTVNMCDQQKEKCLATQQTARVQDFQTGVASMNIGPDPLFPDFDLICEG